MIEDNNIYFDASKIGMGKIKIIPTQKVVRKAMSYMKILAKLNVSEADLSKNDDSLDFNKIINILDLSNDFLDATNNFVFDIVQPNKTEKNKFENLLVQDSLSFAVKLAQKILGMDNSKEGDQKS